MLVDKKVKVLWNVDAVQFGTWLRRFRNCFAPKMEVAVHSGTLVYICRNRGHH
jgi:hypothetical protein